MLSFLVSVFCVSLILRSAITHMQTCPYYRNLTETATDTVFENIYSFFQEQPLIIFQEGPFVPRTDMNFPGGSIVFQTSTNFPGGLIEKTRFFKEVLSVRRTMGF